MPRVISARHDRKTAGPKRWRNDYRSQAQCGAIQRVGFVIGTAAQADTSISRSPTALGIATTHLRTRFLAKDFEITAIVARQNRIAVYCNQIDQKPAEIMRVKNGEVPEWSKGAVC
jgi:hypothetical protein